MTFKQTNIHMAVNISFIEMITNTKHVPTTILLVDINVNIYT